MRKAMEKENVKISQRCSFGELGLFDDYFMGKVYEYFGNNPITEECKIDGKLYINVRVEPFKTILKQCEQFYNEHTILWHGWDIIKADSEHLFLKEEYGKYLEPLSEAMKCAFENKFSDKCTEVRYVCDTILFTREEFEQVETIEDLDNLLKKYSVFFGYDYEKTMLELADAVLVYSK